MRIEAMENPEQWHQTIEKEKVVITDFWASWCRPCLMIAETFKKIQEEDKEKFKDVVVANIDTESSEMQQLSMEQRITSIPTLMIFINGQKVGFDTGDGNSMDRIMGALPKEQLEGLLGAIVDEANKSHEVSA